MGGWSEEEEEEKEGKVEVERGGGRAEEEEEEEKEEEEGRMERVGMRPAFPSRRHSVSTPQAVKRLGWVGGWVGG